MTGLTPLMARALNYLSEYQEAYGVSPTYAEIATALNLKAKSSVSRLVSALEERRLIRREAFRVRSIEVIDQNPLKSVPTGKLIAELRRRKVDTSRLDLPLGAEAEGGAAVPNSHSEVPPRQLEKSVSHGGSYAEDGQRNHG